jgi:hypothetical protein
MSTLAERPTDCTLDPSAGKKHVVLNNNVKVQLSWNICTSIVKDIVFELAQIQDVPQSSNAVLKEAARLVSELELKIKEPLSPFAGNVASAIKQRSIQQPEYQFGANIPVSDAELEVNGWDGVMVTLKSSAQQTQINVHYWANP